MSPISEVRHAELNSASGSEIGTQFGTRPRIKSGDAGSLVSGTSQVWGLYIHWPFCVSKCPYCDFNSHVRETVPETRYRDALVTEIRTAGVRAGHPPLGSIFFGGGTPSLMDAETVAAAIAAAKQAFSAEDDLEISLEANPSSVEAAKFAGFAEAGVNRVSLGIQSFDDDALRFLGRAHDANAARAAIETAQRAFDRVSIDLIYALPNQPRANWQSQLDEALSLGTHHLSLYQLTIEPGTGFEGHVKRGTLTPMDEDRAADLFEFTQERLEASGLPAYEISNHARPGDECRHNLVYWRGQPYAAVGAGAHGRWLDPDGWYATAAHKKPERWLEAVEKRGDGIAETTALSHTERAEEMLMMGLRLRQGINLSLAEAAIDQNALRALEEDRWLTLLDGQLKLTDKGWPVANQILAQLIR
ncbi:MAG: radical SAM family heme chaperone HemW [Pseudomonadota bacterium]